MKWYQHLFWKIFLTFWAISSIGTGIVVLTMQVVSEHRSNLELVETRLRGQATMLIDRYERGDDIRRSHRILRMHGMMEHEESSSKKPLWIIDLATGKQITGPSRRPEDRDLVHLTIDEGNGHVYKAMTLLPPAQFIFQRLVTMMVSVQAGLLLAVSALASLLLSWLVVHPINQLREHARELYTGENLGSRASERFCRRRDEIGELAREFNRMAAHVETTLTAQQHLLQDVSHELRAPLARLQVAVGLAEQRLGEDDSTIKRINHECDRLNSLIGEILSLSRLDQADPQGKVFKVADLFHELISDLAFSAPSRRIDSRIEPPTLQLSANRSLLQKALNNLINNALKYTPSETAMTLHCCRDDDGVELVLRDHGAGIPEDKLMQMLKPFVRGEGQHGRGYGLGLSIAQRAITRLGGKLTLSNHPEGGLVATIQLPGECLAS